jgi:hypothetical protein
LNWVVPETFKFKLPAVVFKIDCALPGVSAKAGIADPIERSAAKRMAFFIEEMVPDQGFRYIRICTSCILANLRLPGVSCFIANQGECAAPANPRHKANIALLTSWGHFYKPHGALWPFSLEVDIAT